MKPEDRARLEEIRGAATRNLEVSDDRLFELLRIIDEQAAEIAQLNAQLTEERAKRETAEQTCRGYEGARAEDGYDRSWVAAFSEQKERADKAERELAEERANSRGVERLRASHYELEGIVCRDDRRDGSPFE